MKLRAEALRVQLLSYGWLERLDVQRCAQQGSDSMRRKTKTFAFLFALLAWSGYATASRGEDSRDPSHFTYARLYCAPDGNTHFQNVQECVCAGNQRNSQLREIVGNRLAASASVAKLLLDMREALAIIRRDPLGFRL
jgi:hypothetical protein